MVILEEKKTKKAASKMPINLRVNSSDPLAGSYEPKSDEEREYLLRVMTDLTEDRKLRARSFPLLNNKTVIDIWNDSMKDWVILAEKQQPDDWIVPYSSTISREKVITALAQLLANSTPPGVVAQNREQKVDRLMSRVLKVLKKYADSRDGFPSSNGKRKRLMCALECMVYGTVHVGEEIVDGECVRNIWANEEVYIPNFWQPDLQKQAHLIRAVESVSWSEAMMLYGDKDNFKYVSTNSSEHWWKNDSDFKNVDIGMSTENGQCTVLYVWYPVLKADLKRGEKIAKYFNVIINGVPMYDWDNRSPYKHGYYPCGKEIFEEYDNLFYYGISLPGKARQDKNYLDFWKTALRAKQKLATFPPFIAWNGLDVRANVIVPNKVTQMTGNKADFTLLHEKLAEGVTGSETTMLKLAEGDIDKTTNSPLVAGQQATGNPTAREVATQASFAQQNQGPSIDRFFALEACLDYLRLSNIVQFWPKRKIDGLCRVSVPDHSLQDGRRGTLEVLFEPIPEMTEEEMMKASEAVLQSEMKSEKNKEYKETVVIDPTYLKELSLFVTLEEKGTTDMDYMRELDFVKQSVAFQGIANLREVYKGFVRASDKDEDIYLTEEQPVQATGAPVAPPAGGASPASGVAPGGLAESLGAPNAPAPSPIMPGAPANAPI